MKTRLSAILLMALFCVCTSLQAQDDAQDRALVHLSIKTSKNECFPRLSEIKWHLMKASQMRRTEEMLIQSLEADDQDVLEKARERIGQLRVELETMESLEDRLMKWKSDPSQKEPLIKEARLRLTNIEEQRKINQDPIEEELRKLNAEFADEETAFQKLMQSYSLEQGKTDLTRELTRNRVGSSFTRSHTQFEYHSSRDTSKLIINVSYVRDSFRAIRTPGQKHGRFNVISKSRNSATVRIDNFEVTIIAVGGQWTGDQVIDAAFELVDIEKLEQFNLK